MVRPRLGNMPVSEDEGVDTEDLISVGFSQLGSESQWRSANTKSIQKALNIDNGFLLEFNNARQKQENQIKAIRGFISQRVDYIAFSPVTEEGWDVVLGEAKDAGIPVILVDRRINTNDMSLYTCWIGTDTVAEGTRAGKWLEEYLASKKKANAMINIVVLQGTLGSTAQLGRSVGFNSVAAMHPGWRILEEASADFTASKGKEVMADFIKKYGKIDVVVSQNDDMTFGAVAAMQEAGINVGENGVVIISFDGVKEALKLVQQGIINVDLECNPEQGEYIVDIIHRLENGEKVDRSNVVDEQVFTKDNVDRFIYDRSY